MLRSLAYLGDLEDDPAVAVSVEELEEYWRGRIPQIAAHLSRFGYDSGSIGDAEGDALAIARLGVLDNAVSTNAIGPHRPAHGKCTVRTKKRRRCPFDALAGMAVCGLHKQAGPR